MKKLLAIAALALAAPVFAQSTYPTPAGSRVNGDVPLLCDVNGANCAPISASNPLPVSGSGGSSVPTGSAGSPNASVVTVQGITGGTPQNVAQSGTWNVGVTSLPALATGSNAIGSITNTSFGVSSLPALAAGANNIGSLTNITGTISLPTGAATAANQLATGASAQTVQGNVANGGTEAGNPVPIGGVAATPWSLPAAQTAGNRVKAAMTTNGATLDVPVPQASSFKLASSAAAGGAVVVKASAGSACQVTGYNTLAAVTWVHIYNKATAPTFGTDASLVSFPVAQSAPFSYTVQNCLAMSAGIGLAFSSDALATQGLSAGAVTGVDVIYN